MSRCACDHAGDAGCDEKPVKIIQFQHSRRQCVLMIKVRVMKRWLRLWLTLASERNLRDSPEEREEEVIK